jgi:hypothetical protein
MREVTTCPPALYKRLSAEAADNLAARHQVLQDTCRALGRAPASQFDNLQRWLRDELVKEVLNQVDKIEKEEP